MTDDFLTEFLTTILREQGVDDPRRVAERAAADLRKARIVRPQHVETAELHQRVEEMSRKGVSSTAIAVRLRMNRVSVSKIIRTLHDQRKAG